MLGGNGISEGDDQGPARKPSLVDDAYRSLKTAIRENTFLPGYQGSEQEIAADLKMSRTPVHEALIRLQAEGLVRILPRRGIVVSPVSPDDIREIYDVTIALEAMAAELNAGKSPKERRAIAEELTGFNGEMRERLRADDLVGWAKSDESFHKSLIVRCGNGRLTRMLATVLDQSHRARLLTLRLRPKPVQSPAEHAKIIDAIRSGDTQGASEAARSHRINARDQIVPLLREYGMRRL
jgi:DNA-binding GntR family transcriptional regulator